MIGCYLYRIWTRHRPSTPLVKSKKRVGSRGQIEQAMAAGRETALEDDAISFVPSAKRLRITVSGAECEGKIWHAN
jgi:hypothetical protein